MCGPVWDRETGQTVSGHSLASRFYLSPPVQREGDQRLSVCLVLRLGSGLDVQTGVGHHLSGVVPRMPRGLLSQLRIAFMMGGSGGCGARRRLERARGRGSVPVRARGGREV